MARIDTYTRSSFTAKALRTLAQPSAVSLFDLGAAPSDTIEGATPHGEIIQSAILIAMAEKRRLIIPAGYYGIDAPVGSVAMGVSIEIEGIGGRPVFVPTQGFIDSGATDLLSFKPATVSISAAVVTADILPNQNVIPVVSTAGMEPGMALCIRSPTVWPYDGRGMWTLGEQHEIARVVSATLVEIVGVTRFSYGLVADAPTLRCWKQSRVNVSNLAFEYPVIPTADNDQSRGGLYVAMARGPELHGLDFYGGGGPGITIDRCAHTRLENWSAGRMGFETQGYGCSIRGGFDHNVADFHTWGCRRAVDGNWMYAPACDLRVSDFSVVGGSYEADGTSAYWPGAEDSFGIGSHGPCVGMSIYDGTVSNFRQGITCRGLDTTIRDVDFTGRMECAISLFFGNGLTVKGCTLDRGDFPFTQNPANTPASFVRLGAALGDNESRPVYGMPIEISGNTIVGTTRGIVELYNAGTVTRLTVTNNVCVAGPTADAEWFQVYTAGGEAIVNNSEIHSNRVTRLNEQNLIGTIDPAVGVGVSASFGRSVKTGDREWTATIPDDGAARMCWLADAGIPEGSSVWVTLIGPDAASSGRFLLLPTGASALANMGASVATTNLSVGGTTGTDNRITVSMGTGDIRIENRLGVSIRVRLGLY